MFQLNRLLATEACYRAMNAAQIARIKYGDVQMTERVDTVCGRVENPSCHSKRESFTCDVL
eukprot:4320730-Amphidinium_carterae.1